MLLCLSLCMVLLVTWSAVQSRVQTSEIRGNADETRLKRSIYTIGKLAAQQLLRGAKFVYTNGFDTVFVKKGGFREALEDFDRVNTAKGKVNFPGESEAPNVVKRGKVGDRYLLLQKSPSGTGVLRISRAVMKNRIMLTVDPLVDKIIVYTD